MHRRAFLKRTLASTSVVAGMSQLNPAALAAVEKPEEASRFEVVPPRVDPPGSGSVKEKAEKILKWGGCGLEFHGIDVRRAEQIEKELEGLGMSPAALCYGSHGGDYVSLDLAKRRKARADFKRVLDAAAALGSTGVVWVPCFNGESS